MKEYKICGRFTNESVQRAFRHPEKATILEAAGSMLVVGAVGYTADLAAEGTIALAKWTWKKITNKKSKKGGKK